MGALQAVLDNGAKIELDHHLVYYARTSYLSSPSLPLSCPFFFLFSPLSFCFDVLFPFPLFPSPAILAPHFTFPPSTPAQLCVRKNPDH